MEVISIMDYIGYQGPYLCSFITCLSLLEKPFYLIIFIIGCYLNYLLNYRLKGIIKEPRPKYPVVYIDDNLIKRAEIYGMPSGHAQSISFAIVFLFLTKGHTYLIFISFL
jgi:membrane-associated phospholipid phosphatase